MKIAGAVAVVTGASRGIGAATAAALAEGGAHVALLARSEKVQQQAAALADRGLKATAYRVDVSSPEEVTAAAASISADLGVPDIVVNNAGAGRYLALDETTMSEARAMIEVPCLSAIYVTRAFLPAMLARRRGVVANVTSPAAQIPWPGATVYSTARWAVRGFDAALKLDLRGTGVRSMLVMPGKTSSTYFEHNPGTEDRIPGVTRMIPTVTPEEVGRAIVRGIERDSGRVVVPQMLRLVLLAHSILPQPVEALVVRTGWRRPALD